MDTLNPMTDEDWADEKVAQVLEDCLVGAAESLADAAWLHDLAMLSGPQ